MKKLILFAAILFAGVSVVNAQAGEPIKETIDLKLNLHPFQSITIGGEAGDVDGAEGLVSGAVQLDYKTKENYNDGVARTIKNHISVIAAGGYSVTVNSTADNLNAVSGEGDVLSASSITVTAINGTASTVTPKAEFRAVPLSLTGGELLSSEKGSGKGNSFDVTYTGSKENFYNNFINANGQVAKYETTVTYTIAAK